MPVLRCLILTGFLGLIVLLSPAPIHAQGLTTAAIQGTVRMTDQTAPDGARVVVRNQATGFSVEVEVRRGRFLVQGLEPGGPYRITVRRIGAAARRWDGIFLKLGQPLELEVVLEPAPVQLDSVMVLADDAAPRPGHHGGTAATISDSLVHRLPSLNRDIYDFVGLVPQISTRTGFTRGMSSGGVGFRFNHFLTNGVSERSLGGGQPPEFAGGKSLPLEAVREYQVLVAPFDVRYGDFAGAMVNTVTRAGTNRFVASAFGQVRSDALARGGEMGADQYERWQYGISLSGPIIRDRAQLLVAAEFVHQVAPMTGPFVGQPGGTPTTVPVSLAQLERLQDLMSTYQLSAGSGGAVKNRTVLRNGFARLDASVPEVSSRAVLWLNRPQTEGRGFNRQSSPRVFELTSYSYTQVQKPTTLAFQVFTTLPASGVHNEFSLSHRSNSFRGMPEVAQPIIQAEVDNLSGGITTLVTGTPAQAQGGGQRSRNLNLRDGLTVPVGRSHVVNLGFDVEWFRFEAGRGVNGYGTWTFSSLDSLAAGAARRYEVSRDFGGAGVSLTGNQVAAWIGDSWRPGGRFSLTAGLRAEFLSVGEPPPYNQAIDSLFGRRTDRVPARRVHLSPRLGFTWDPGGEGRDLLRGGIGVFTGRPPLAWMHTPLQSYGTGIGTLRCGDEPGDRGPPPAFNPDYRNPPLACAGGDELADAPAGNVDLVDPDLWMARTLRVALAWERRFPGNLTATAEALFTRNLSDFAFVNLNLAGPQATDSTGRVLYGTFLPTGRSRPVRVTDSFPSVVELQNVGRNHSVQLAASLSREFSNGFSLLASYTWTRVRDVQTPLRVNNRGFVNWSLRTISGRHDDLTPGISLNDVPHRVAVAGTWRAPWRRWTTELSLLYIGESGSPFTWIAGGTEGRGDLNADGALNDPIYVPRTAFDADEISFTGLSTEPGADNSPEAQAARVTAQRLALEQFIGEHACLRRHRGRILERNSCREPWAETTAISVRQSIPLGRRMLEAQLDLFNVLNLLDRSGGLRRIARSGGELLEHVESTPVAGGPPTPVFRFQSAADAWELDRAASAYQLQLGVRYRF